MNDLTKQAEFGRAQVWLTQHFWRPAVVDGELTGFPVTFPYDGRESGALLAEWKTLRGQLRRLILAHYTPRPNGQLD